ncbi:hypothetical protein [Lacrimispora sp.]|uniref:hypothetical protein n=1 Tax=Lacrimispora sp. TaxID=2719234 RepID=UPI0029E5C8C6|nr:hypothetical protein [Lacrimispora sp.]
MSKSDKELAVELTIAQIQASSVIKTNVNQSGMVLKADTVWSLVEGYYKKLGSLNDKTE